MRICGVTIPCPPLSSSSNASSPTNEQGVHENSASLTEEHNQQPSAQPPAVITSRRQSDRSSRYRIERQSRPESGSRSNSVNEEQIVQAHGSPSSIASVKESQPGHLQPAEESPLSERSTVTPYISRHQLVPVLEDPYFAQLTPQEYQAARSHPERPIKNRPSSMIVAETDAADNITIVQSHPAHDENMRRHFMLQPDADVKIIGYNPGGNNPIASTGTSQLKTPCFTEGLDVCSAVAIGGEKVADGNHRLPGAKVRVFHVFPYNVNVSETISAYVTQLRNEGLTVKAAAYGGDSAYDYSVAASENLRAVLRELSIPVEFDEMCDKRPDRISSLLGAVIRDDHSVQFFTKLAMTVPEEDDDEEIASTASTNDRS